MTVAASIEWSALERAIRKSILETSGLDTIGRVEPPPTSTAVELVLKSQETARRCAQTAGSSAPFNMEMVKAAMAKLEANSARMLAELEHLPEPERRKFYEGTFPVIVAVDPAGPDSDMTVETTYREVRQ